MTDHNLMLVSTDAHRLNKRTVYTKTYHVPDEICPDCNEPLARHSLSYQGYVLVPGGDSGRKFGAGLFGTTAVMAVRVNEAIELAEAHEPAFTADNILPFLECTADEYMLRLIVAEPGDGADSTGEMIALARYLSSSGLVSSLDESWKNYVELLSVIGLLGDPPAERTVIFGAYDILEGVLPEDPYDEADQVVIMTSAPAEVDDDQEGESKAA